LAHKFLWKTHVAVMPQKCDFLAHDVVALRKRP